MLLPRFFLHVLPYRKYLITGQSMEPTLREGSMVLVSKLSYLILPPKKGDLIALLHPYTKQPIIKRIIDISEDGYSVMGDNKQASTDSRHFGEISRKQIIGKVVALL